MGTVWTSYVLMNVRIQRVFSLVSTQTVSFVINFSAETLKLPDDVIFFVRPQFSLSSQCFVAEGTLDNGLSVVVYVPDKICFDQGLIRAQVAAIRRSKLFIFYKLQLQRNKKIC
jgi:hypothetical protein